MNRFPRWNTRLPRVAFCLVALFAACAQAQSWPTKPVRFVVSTTPGTGADIIGRVVAERLSHALGQPIVVENRAGAAGNIGAEMVAKTAPDGYTLLLTNAALPIVAATFAKPPFDVQKDFEHVAIVGTSQFVLVVSAGIPVQNVQELIAYGKARRDEMSFASVGVGSPLYLGLALFSVMTGTRVLHVPYKGSTPALADMAAGRIDLMFTTYSSAKSFIDSGKVRLLAAGGNARMQTLPGVPTMHEAGVKGFAVDGWYGVAAAAKTPEPIVNRIAREIQTLLAQPEVKEKLVALGFDVYYEGPRELRQRIDREVAMWVKLVADLGIKTE